MKLILGTCFNYDLSTIFPFLDSLEDIFDGTVWLITDNKFNYQPKTFRLIVDILSAEQLVQQSPVSLANANNYRYFLYQHILNRHPEYMHVLLTDVRDVVFQTDPFAEMPTEKLVVCQEEKSILEEPYNSGWISAVYGKSYLQKIGEEPVFCSGTILGKRAIMMIFLRDICREMIDHGPRLDAGNGRMVIDQALFIDWVLHNKDLVEINDNSTGRIFTMGHACKFCFDIHGQLINQSAQPFSILHQYDRFPFLVKLLAKRQKRGNTMDQKLVKFWRSMLRDVKKTK